MAGNEIKRLTAEMLIKRASSEERKKNQYKEYYSSYLGGSIMFKKIPLLEIQKILDKSGIDGEELEINKELIYKTCPILQNKELQKEYECAEPYDIVYKIVDDNIGEINRMVETILSMYGLGDVEKEIENVKN